MENRVELKALDGKDKLTKLYNIDANKDMGKKPLFSSG